MFTGIFCIVFSMSNLIKAKSWYMDLINDLPGSVLPKLRGFNTGYFLIAAGELTGRKNEVDIGAAAYWGKVDIQVECKRLMEKGAKLQKAKNNTFGGISGRSFLDPWGQSFVLGGIRFPGAEENRQDEWESAIRTAFVRAVNSKTCSNSLTQQDNLAKIFLPPDLKNSLGDEKNWLYIKETLMPPGMFEYVTARTAIIDKVMLEQIQGDCRQVVILGSGCDTRAYRYGRMFDDIGFFELDLPEILERKIDSLYRAGVIIPPNVSIVAIDFNNQNIEESLNRAGFDPRLKTLFIWEGVSYYLTARAAGNILRSIRYFSPAGSSIVFDYIFNKRLEQIIAGGILKQDEAEKSNFNVDISNIKGFNVKSRYMPENMNRFGASAGLPFDLSPCPDCYSIVHAEVGV